MMKYAYNLRVYCARTAYEKKQPARTAATDRVGCFFFYMNRKQFRTISGKQTINRPGVFRHFELFFIHLSQNIFFFLT